MFKAVSHFTLLFALFSSVAFAQVTPIIDVLRDPGQLSTDGSMDLGIQDGPRLIVGVNYTGFGSGQIRYFEFQTHLGFRHLDNTDQLDFVDVQLTPIEAVWPGGDSENGTRSLTAVRGLPMIAERDLNLGLNQSATVYLFGGEFASATQNLYIDAVADVLGIQNYILSGVNPAISPAAVTEGSLSHVSVQLGSVISQSLMSGMSLRISGGVDLVTPASQGPMTSDSFLRAAVTLRDTFSAFMQAGERTLSAGPVSTTHHHVPLYEREEGYRYVQIGVKAPL